MTKEQKMELRKMLREKFIERVKARVSRDIEGEGLRVMSDYLASYSKNQPSAVLAFMRIGEDWNFAECARSVEVLKMIYKEFGLTHNVMPLEFFVSQYAVMYASEAVRVIHEWRERNGVECETAY